MSTIGRMYYQGTMPLEPQSYEISFRYQSQAAEKDAWAAAERIMMLRGGIGCEFDYGKVLQYLRDNTRKGDDVSLMALAQFDRDRSNRKHPV